MAQQGYSSDWYDVDDSDESQFEFTVAVPEKNGDLYFNVDSYYYNMMPAECTTGSYPDIEGNQVNVFLPIVALIVTNQRTNESDYEYYFEQQSRPIYVSSEAYEAGDTFTVEVYRGYMDDYPHKDFTLSVYSKQNLSILDSQN